jgi:hypothetical protein
MKTRKEIVALLSQQVNLADTKANFDATMKSIDTTYKAIQAKLKKLESSFNRDPEPDGYVREINNVLESLKDINSSL